MLQTDYLVIGSGAASMAFCDTLLTELSDVRIIIVDRHSAPGGHWNDAYDFIQLHAPSITYGVSSSQLEGNWLKLLLLKWQLPFTHRATKQEILTYYKTLMDRWVASGKVKYYPKCTYNFENQQQQQDSSFRHHIFTNLDGTKSYEVQVDVKLINGTIGECNVPSQTPPDFPVDDAVLFFTPNELYQQDTTNTKNAEKYVILGCGKTAVDAILYLQLRQHVAPDNITWIISNDVWMMKRHSNALPWAWNQALIDHDMDLKAATSDLEQQGILTRLDMTVEPTKFRYPVIDDDELECLRNIPEKNRIRRGRVSKIRFVPENCGDESKMMCRVDFLNNNMESMWLTKEHIFVNCTSPGPFNRKDANNLSPFSSDGELRLNFLFSPPAPWSSSCLAVLESRRRKGTLDLEFGQNILEAWYGSNKKYSENDILQALIPGYGLLATDDAASGNLVLHATQPTKNLAGFLALYDQDPMKGYTWMTQNRLSLFYVFGFRSRVYENMVRLIDKKHMYALSTKEAQAMSIMAEKLKPLQGK